MSAKLHRDGCACYESPRDRQCRVHPRPPEFSVSPQLGFERDGERVRVRVGAWGREKMVRVGLADFASVIAHVVDGGSAASFAAAEKSCDPARWLVDQQRALAAASLRERALRAKIEALPGYSFVPDSDVGRAYMHKESSSATAEYWECSAVRRLLTPDPLPSTPEAKP